MLFGVRGVQLQFFRTTGHAIYSCIFAPDEADFHNGILFGRKILQCIGHNILPAVRINLRIGLGNDDRRLLSCFTAAVNRLQGCYARNSKDDRIRFTVGCFLSVQDPVLERISIYGRRDKGLGIACAHDFRNAVFQGSACVVRILNADGILIAVCNIIGDDDDGVCAFHGSIDRIFRRFRRCRLTVLVSNIPAFEDVAHLIGIILRVRNGLAGRICAGLNNLFEGVAENDHRDRIGSIGCCIIRGDLRVGRQGKREVFLRGKNVPGSIYPVQELFRSVTVREIHPLTSIIGCCEHVALNGAVVYDICRAMYRQLKQCTLGYLKQGHQAYVLGDSKRISLLSAQDRLEGRIVTAVPTDEMIPFTRICRNGSTVSVVICPAA